MSPDAFNERLAETFGGRLRLRWSSPSKEWHIEEKVGRGIFDPPRRNEADADRVERARDGYNLVLRIREGDRMPCPQCSTTLRVPVMQWRETRCPVCEKAGRDPGIMACYFPLGELLLDHLRKIDPLNDGVQRQAAEIAKNNEHVQFGGERALHGELHDALYDAAIEQIPSFSYSGQTAAWQD